MNKISKEKRDKLILIGIGTLVVMAGLWFALISTQQKGLKDTIGKAQAMKDKVADAEKTMKQAVVIDAQLTEKMEELNAAESKMASGDMYSWFLITMNKFIADRQLNLNATKPNVGEVGIIPVFPYQAATFNVKLTGYYHEIGKFTADFENAFPFAQLRNLDISPTTTPGVDDREKLDFRFDVVALIKPAPSDDTKNK